MANNTTTVNINETRSVILEPPKPPAPRLKQFIALEGLSFDKKNYKQGDLVRLSESDAVVFLAARQITPLEVALREGIYPIAKESVTEKFVEAVTGQEIPDTPAAIEAEAGTKKSFLGNALRDAIQKKKAETNPALAPTKVDAAKLAAIKAGGKK